jgi:hypothetical protein
MLNIVPCEKTIYQCLSIPGILASFPTDLTTREASLLRHAVGLVSRARALPHAAIFRSPALKLHRQVGKAMPLPNSTTVKLRTPGALRACAYIKSGCGGVCQVRCAAFNAGFAVDLEARHAECSSCTHAAAAFAVSVQALLAAGAAAAGGLAVFICCAHSLQMGYRHPCAMYKGPPVQATDVKSLHAPTFRTRPCCASPTCPSPQSAALCLCLREKRKHKAPGAWGRCQVGAHCEHPPLQCSTGLRRHVIVL